MKNLTIYIALLLTLSIVACTKSGSKTTMVFTENRDVNTWLDTTFREHYLWAASMSKEVDEQELNLKPELFLNSHIRYRSNHQVHYSEDTYGDRFSHISALSATRGTRSSDDDTVHDFGFMMRGVTNQNDQMLYAHVLYVIDGSPAQKAGLTRGDVIVGINNKMMPQSWSTVEYEYEKEEIDLNIIYPTQRVVTVRRATYEDRPIVFDSVYTDAFGERTGYIMYNFFADGAKNQHAASLQNAFSEFKSAGVRNMIVDLRYNGGGELRTARLLASMLVNAEHLGEEYMFIEDKNSFMRQSLFQPNFFMKANEIPNSNLDLDKLYIITSRHTASASELIIHTLKPFFNERLFVVGDTTVGKNVGGYTITNKSYNWELNPITIRIHNVHKVSGYEKGIAPKWKALEQHSVTAGNNQEYISVAQYGDTENDNILNTIVNGGIRLPGLSDHGNSTKGASDSEYRFRSMIRDRGVIVGRIVEE